MSSEEQIIDARRGEILRLLDQGVEFNRNVRLFLAEKYGCSEPTIEAEINLLRSVPASVLRTGLQRDRCKRKR
jgi:hypothetical protein